MEEPSTEENDDVNNVINILSELLKLNRKYGQLLDTGRKILSTDQSPNMALTTNRESTNEIGSPKKLSGR